MALGAPPDRRDRGDYSRGVRVMSVHELGRNLCCATHGHGANVWPLEPRARRRSMNASRLVSVIGLLVLLSWLLVGCSQDVLDEARLANRNVQSFPAADEDYFHDMDGG